MDMMEAAGFCLGCFFKHLSHHYSRKLTYFFHIWHIYVWGLNIAGLIVFESQNTKKMQLKVITNRKKMYEIYVCFNLLLCLQLCGCVSLSQPICCTSRCRVMHLLFLFGTFISFLLINLISWFRSDAFLNSKQENWEDRWGDLKWSFR